ncbi:hypothetical protein MASR1M60_05390 [Rhodocyclaceae bacterium]
MKKLLPAVFAIFIPVAHAQLIECIDSRGNSRYSETPCRADERDPRKIHRRNSDARKVESHDVYQQGELERQAQKREAAARAAEEERRLNDMIRIEQQLRKEAAAALLDKLEADKNSRKH